jgi:DNA polymerase-3 subunit alpha
MLENTPVVVTGRLSARDEKEPQIVLDTLRPITDITELGVRSEELGVGNQGSSGSNLARGKVSGKKLFVKLTSEDSAEYERIKLILTMFPGREQMVIHFADTKKNVGTTCVIHGALIRELSDMLGGESVVVK